MKIIRTRRKEIVHDNLGGSLIVANNLIMIEVCWKNPDLTIQARTSYQLIIELISIPGEDWGLVKQEKIAFAALEDILNWLATPKSENYEHNIYTIKTVDEYARLAKIERPKGEGC